MQGLILELIRSDQPEPKFWDLFSSISSELDRLFWYFPGQNWFGPPEGIEELDLYAPLNLQLSENARVSGEFWRPGSLSIIADDMNEELIELWGIEPEDAAQFSALDPRQHQHLHWVERHAAFWIKYVDSSSWEIFTQKRFLLERLTRGLEHQTKVRVHSTDTNCRDKSFRRAGFNEEFIRCVVPKK